MTTTPSAITALETALDRLARGLATGDSEAVLSAEEPLASAVAALTASTRQEAVETEGLALSIVRVRAALARCQSLGRAAEEFSRALFPQATYGRGGIRVVIPAPSRRVTSLT